ncbi:hypothetical protein DAI22_08g099932 [Oryza sativa Japonica Group]|nr:hypothetical protein DAI22_08g099932 [Oryza sativa Japonica Group]
MKPRGEMSNEVLACWIEMFNEECREDSKMQSNIKKYFLYVFSPIISLIAETNKFQPNTCSRRLQVINKEKLVKQDLRNRRRNKEDNVSVNTSYLFHLLHIFCFTKFK